MYKIIIRGIGESTLYDDFVSRAETMVCAISEGIGFIKGRCETLVVKLEGIGDGKFNVFIDDKAAGIMNISKM